MKNYVRVSNGAVVETLSTDGDITTMFPPELVWVDVTDIVPPPAQGWLATQADGAWAFTAPAEAGPTLDQLKATLCATIDANADIAYIAIGGKSPGRLAEYQQAKADAVAFAGASYAGDVPATISCWAQASGWTAQQACDDILATAAAWESALVAIRSARLLGKANVNAAGTEAAAHAAGL